MGVHGHLDAWETTIQNYRQLISPPLNNFGRQFDCRPKLLLSAADDSQHPDDIPLLYHIVFRSLLLVDHHQCNHLRYNSESGKRLADSSSGFHLDFGLSANQVTQ